jgi:hypothetical protein
MGEKVTGSIEKEFVSNLVLTITPMGFHHFYDDGFIHKAGGFG